MILVTTCFPIESRSIERRPDLRLVRTAVGEDSRQSMEQLGDGVKDASLLIAAGFCGGIDPRLGRGHLCLAKTIRHRSDEIPVDPSLLQRSQDALSGASAALHVGIVESADRVLDPAAKLALAADGATTVDMESGPLARWAGEHEIPFLALRVVLDPAGEDLPFTGDRPFWSSALRHPIVAARTWRHAAEASRVLGSAVDRLVDGLNGEADG